MAVWAGQKDTIAVSRELYEQNTIYVFFISPARLIV